MKQVFQDRKSGELQVVEVAVPALRPGTILVRNAASVISPGTERDSVLLGKSSYVATARYRPDLVQRVVDTVRREGVLAAYRKVQAKLSEYQPLGYSSAGAIVEVSSGLGRSFQVGDYVACAGAGLANHAEVVCIPSNLVARVPSGVSLDAAAFGTLGSIALQAVRQATPTLGERFCVIGLGIIGLLTVQLLKASGVRVFAIDLCDELVAKALLQGAEEGTSEGVDGQGARAREWSGGIGVDGVIVAASTQENSPMVAAAEMCRDRARVVAVGRVPFGLPRDIAYAKELELRMSRSYGPGRYDRSYEEKGVDYPIGYVRWSEARNLQAFLHLIESGSIDPLALVTHRFPVDKAPEAYDQLLNKEKPRPLGVLLSYPDAKEDEQADRGLSGGVRLAAPVRAPALRDTDEIFTGVIGAGAFASSVLIPALKTVPRLKLRTVVTANGLSALQAQRRFRFETSGTDIDAVLQDDSIQLVVIATRHNHHAPLVVRALNAGKHVFVEKPLALNEEQLVQVEEALAAAQGRLFVGYNRRFSPQAKAIKDALGGRGPLNILYRVNSEPLSKEHWILDREIGGGRIIGEACHFVDLMSFLAGDSQLQSVSAATSGVRNSLGDNFSAVLSFADGTVGSLTCTSRGSARVGKELIEVHGGGGSAIIDNFRSGRVALGRRVHRLKGKGKGHRQEVHVLAGAVRGGCEWPIASTTLLSVSRATFMIENALRCRRAVGPENRLSMDSRE
jgi:polar amino acid transport system substrate-binding protein